MSISNRASKLTKLHRILKKHYQPVVPVERPLLEHLLYACCLEVAGHDAADQAFACLQEAYFDWNEVRVTTVSELSEVMRCLPHPSAAAARLKRTLQSVFETYYAFEIEALKKENIGQAVKKLQQLDGITPFAIAYATQNGLGGHAIAVNSGALETLYIVGAISDKEAEARRVPGLERAIPKSKGIDFASLLHQIAVDYSAARFSSRVRAILLEVDPDAKQRLPKRPPRKKTTRASKSSNQSAAKESAKKTSSTSGNAAKPAGDRVKKSKKKVKPKTSRAAPGEAATGAAKKTSKKTRSAKKSSSDSAKKSPTKRLSRKKPR